MPSTDLSASTILNPVPTTVVGWIEQQMAQHPHATALVDQDQRVSYGELARQVDQWSQLLVAQGVQPEDRVVVCLPRSVELFVVLLAVLRVGAAYVPIDPALPAARRAWMSADAAASLEISTSGTAITLQRLQAVSTVQRPAVQHLDPHQLAYVIYTSGSTGLPKGVAVSHAALNMHIRAIGQCYRLCADDVILHNIAVSFDGATEAWLVGLVHGASVVISPSTVLSPRELLACVRREQVTILGMTPTYLLQLAEEIQQQGRPISVRSYTVGGEAVTREQAVFLRQTLAPAQLINGYGPTETVITPTVWRADASTSLEEWTQTAYLPIGQAVGERQCYVLNEQLEPVLDGTLGELWIGGIGLARGYWQRPALTAARFVADPFGATGGRLYRTGDLVRRLPTGDLEFVGRVDQQIKIRGFRVELGEIESSLGQLAGVHEAVVLTQGEGIHKRLVAYVAGQCQVSTLQHSLLGRLPAWMVPTAWVVLPSLPRLLSGKVDRQALQQLPIDTVDEARSITPLTGIEQELAQLWQQVLPQVTRIGREDSFFALGGHSLLATQLVSLIQQHWQCRLSMEVFYQHASLAQLAVWLTEHATQDDQQQALSLDDIDALLCAMEQSV